MSKLQLSDIDNLATLARIALTDKEKTELLPTLDSIIGLVSEISEVVTEDRPSKAGVVKNVLRDDLLTHSGGEYSDAILANAPDTEDGFLKVKQIF